MTAKSSKFLIGLFVIFGSLICAGILIWVGASRIFMKGTVYAVYFDESVQGLQVDSAIKYRGVEIGKVQRINVAPDFRLIEVIMKVDLEGDLQKHTIASLKTAGITGIVFIELDRIRPGELKDSPQLLFKPDYPVIPSRKSEISRFLADTGTIMDNIKDIDFKGISNNLKNTTSAIEKLAENKRLLNIMINLESSTANLDELMARINETVARGKVEQAISETLGILSDARKMVGEMKSELHALNLREKAQRTDTLIDDVAKKTKVITGDLQDTSENLRVTSENLQKLSENLSRDPSELIFSKPPPPRKPME